MNQKSPPIIIGIAGGTGSGKTTIANVILDRVGADKLGFLPHDAYYKDLTELSTSQREMINFDHPDSLDTPLLVRHLEKLRLWQSVEIPVYDFTNHSRTSKTETIEPQPVILVEGILIFAESSLRPLFDVKIFVDTPPDIRFIRRLRRDIVERGDSSDGRAPGYQPGGRRFESCSPLQEA